MVASFSVAAMCGVLALTAGAPAQAADPAALDGAWSDDFTATALGTEWSIVNEATDAWSLTSTPGALTLTAQVGDTYQTANSAKNVFMVDIPVGDFTAVTTFDAPVALDFAGSGMIAWKDIDNYVRVGLSHVAFADAGAIVIENGLETAATYGATFTPRPASTGETLKMERVGDLVTTSFWDGATWVQVAQVTVAFDITQVGLYALAALDGTAHTATFDSFSVAAADGADVVPAGTFTLHGPEAAWYLASTDAGLGLVAERPATVVALTAAAGTDGAITLATSGAGLPVVLADGTLSIGADGDEPASLRLTDAGGGKLILRTAGSTGDDGYLGLVDGLLTVGAIADAVKLTLEAVPEPEVEEGSTLTIDGGGTSHEISDDLYGIFYEDINYAADGGLYAELVRNRSFEFNASDNASFTGLTAWAGVASGQTTVVTDDERLNDTNRFYLSLVAPAAGAGVRNSGYNSGISVTKDATYDFSVWARSTTAQTLTVEVQDVAGDSVLATGTVDVDGSDEWKQYTATLTATATTAAGRLAVLAGAASTVRLDMVSLFPTDTWVGAVNGTSVLRKDLAEKIEALDPSFLRFPGGCVTNVGTFDSYVESGYVDRQRTYQWKETIGAVEERATNWNFWGYNQTYGIGYLEYFELAQDLGATPLPVLSVGANGCGSTIPEMTDPAKIAQWVQDTLDLIEFANGDVTTTWGAVRASLGHPETFDLRYIGLGNEENTSTFEANFPQFKDAIRAAYPDIKILSNSGPDDSGARFDTLWDYNVAQDVDVVDEHYYNDPSWFLANVHRYDDYDRDGPHVFIGEYASRGNTFNNALVEAAYMTGIERNSDVVDLASYAPLLSNESYVQWTPDAIWFDNDESWSSPNYYVQEMFSNNVGDEVVPSTYDGAAAEVPDISGGVFLSTWSTSAAYDNVTVTSNDTDEVLFSDDLADADAWSPQTGTWAATDGEYVQSSTTVTDARSIVADAYTKDWSDYTLELDARKISGSEGFLIGFGATGASSYFWWNLGGWNDTRSVLQKADGGSAGEVKAIESSVIATGQTYHVKVVVSGRVIKLYLDDVLQMEYEDVLATESLFQVVTRDTETDELVVKVVNTSTATQRTAVTVDDVALEGTGTVTEMTASSLTATNTKALKTAVVPVERELTGVSNTFSYDFPASSITFLRLAVADTADPAVSLGVAPQGADGWTPSPTTVTATATDDTAVASVEVQVDGGDWVLTPGTSATATLTADGAHTVLARATDAAGNTSEPVSVAVMVDATAPVSTAVVDAEARTVTVQATDAGAGVTRVEYRTDTDAEWSVYSEPLVVGAWATTVELRATDAVGNVEVAHSTDVPAADAGLEATTTVATVSDTSVSFGERVRLTVRVAGGSVAPTGSVRVLDGGVEVVSAALVRGRATLALPTDLVVGTHTLSVEYPGDETHAASSGVVELTVAKAAASVRATVTPATVTTASTAKVAVSVTTSTGVAATGMVTVDVLRQGQVVATRSAWLSGGKAAVTLPKLSAGAATLRVAYAGSPRVAPASVSSRLTIVGGHRGGGRG